MVTRDGVVDNYDRDDLLEAIRAGLTALGKTPETASLDDLAPVDEFHIGGRQATEAFIEQLELQAEHRVLDIGCGLGGTSRFVASKTGCRVEGIDLTPSFVATGQVLCDWVGLGERVTLHQGDALAPPFESGSFDAATLLHVGMNIPDKASLFAEVARLLKPGGQFGVYDVMLTGDDDLDYPVPWAPAPETSALAAPETYRSTLASAGFEVLAERNRRDFAIAFFDTLQKRLKEAGGPPPLGLHLLMGETAGQKIANMVGNIAAGRIAPVEMIARKL